MTYQKGEKVMTKDEGGRWVVGEIKHYDRSSNMDGSSFQSFRIQIPSGRIVPRGGSEIKPVN